MELIQVSIPGTGVIAMAREDAKKLYESLRPMFARHRARGGMTNEERCIDLWLRYRKRYPDENPNRTVSRITGHYQAPRPSTDQVRVWLRDFSIDIPEPWSPAECAKMARAGRTRSAPKGYRIVDADVWRANSSLMSDAEIRELASGGLAKIGLAIGSSEGDDW